MTSTRSAPDLTRVRDRDATHRQHKTWFMASQHRKLLYANLFAEMEKRIRTKKKYNYEECSFYPHPPTTSSYSSGPRNIPQVQITVNPPIQTVFDGGCARWGRMTVQSVFSYGFCLSCLYLFRGWIWLGVGGNVPRNGELWMHRAW